jgi:hypothetical protein
MQPSLRTQVLKGEAKVVTNSVTNQVGNRGQCRATEGNLSFGLSG